ncbi:MAG: DUF1559 domain-containing protein [Candidatus Nealsonbacteria bacterium]|nr:DUF1559 domain-containing protein [Candidatus Nealsonbacteria bacterium]
MRKPRVFGVVLAAGVPLGLLYGLLCLNGCHRGAKEASPEVSCHWNLELLGKGVTGYRSAHGELPQVSIGPKGDEHSWRVLVVPCVFPEQSGITSSYRLDQPWDSEDNRDALWPGFLENFVHSCPLDPSPTEDRFFTSYLMLVRPSVRDSETGEMKAASLAPDAVLVVESVNCGIEFAEPRDLPWDDLWEGDSPFGKAKLNSLHRDVVMALRVDGKVIEIPKDITKKDLRKLLSGNTQ